MGDPEGEKNWGTRRGKGFNWMKTFGASRGCGKHLGEERFNWMKTFGGGKDLGGRKDLIGPKEGKHMGMKGLGEENIWGGKDLGEERIWEKLTLGNSPSMKFLL